MIKILATAALLAAPVAANSAEPVPSYTVEHADLDLTTEAGIARLDARIEYAAKAMCASGGRDLQSRRYEIECRADVIESSRQVVGLAVAKAKADKVRFAATTSSQPGA